MYWFLFALALLALLVTTVWPRPGKVAIWRVRLFACVLVGALAELVVGIGWLLFGPDLIAIAMFSLGATLLAFMLGPG